MTLVQTREQFKLAQGVLIDSDIITVDTETPSLTDKTVVGVALHSPIKGRDMEISFYLPFRHTHDRSLFGSENLPIEWLQELAPVLEDPNKTYVFHNAPFDLTVLANDNIKIPTGRWVDTAVIARMVWEFYKSYELKDLGTLVDPNAAEMEKKLKKVVEDVGGYQNVPPFAMELYACQDVLLTWKLFQRFWVQIQEEEMEGVWPDEADYAVLLDNMRQTGVKIKKTLVEQLSREIDDKIRAIERELGFEPSKPSQLAHALYAPVEKGGQGLPIYGYNKTKSIEFGNQPVMNEEVLKMYDNPVVRKVLEYRDHGKTNSTYFKAWLNFLGEDGRLHPRWKHNGAETSRLTCSKPNLQQIPRTDEEAVEKGISKSLVKGALDATEGYQLWEFDYSQIEHRLAHCYGQDPKAIEAFKNGEDLYQQIADRLGITRQEAKTLVLSIQYGAGGAKVGEMLRKDPATASDIVAGFRSEYPGLQRVNRAAQKAAKERLWIRLWTGRKLHFQSPEESFMALSKLLQGGAAQIMMHTMLKFYRGEYDRTIPPPIMVGQVHDSLLTEIREDAVEESIPIIKKVMEWPSERFPIPFPVDAKRLA